jgi:hypothetical protein
MGRATGYIGHPDLFPRGRDRRLELPEAVSAGCPAEPLAAVKEEPGGHAVKHGTPAWFAMLVDVAVKPSDGERAGVNGCWP